MQFAIKLTATTAFNGTTLLTPPYPNAGADGVIAISQENIGRIDPDFSAAPPSAAAAVATQPLVLQSYMIQLGAAGQSGDGLEVVDHDGNLAYRIKDFSALNTTPFTFFGDRRWVIPVGFRLKVTGPGPNAVLRLNVWHLTELGDLEIAEPLFP